MHLWNFVCSGNKSFEFHVFEERSRHVLQRPRKHYTWHALTRPLLLLSAMKSVITVPYAETRNLRTLVSGFGRDSVSWNQSQRHSLKCHVIRKESHARVSGIVFTLFFLVCQRWRFSCYRYRSNTFYYFSLGIFTHIPIKIVDDEI